MGFPLGIRSRVAVAVNNLGTRSTYDDGDL